MDYLPLLFRRRATIVLWGVATLGAPGLLWYVGTDPIAALIVAIVLFGFGGLALRLIAPSSPETEALWAQWDNSSAVCVAVERGPEMGKPASIERANSSFYAFVGIKPKDRRSVVSLLLKQFEGGRVDKRAVPSEYHNDDIRTQLMSVAKSEEDSSVRLARSDGAWFLIERRVVARLSRAVWFIRPVNVQKERPFSVEAASGLLSTMLDATPFGLAVVDITDQTTGMLLESNGTFRQLLGLKGKDAKDAKQARFTTLFHSGDQSALTTFLDHAASGEGTSQSVDARPHGLPDKVLTLGVRIVRGAGDKRALLVHATDATEQRRLETQFAQSQKMQALGQLAGGVAHDFNNMLTAIIGFCDLLLNRYHEGDQTFADVMQINQNAKRAARLVRQLLAFSRQQPLKPATLVVSDVLAEISSLLRRVLGERVTLDLIHGKDVRAVRADQTQIEQIIINLAVNARDAMNGDGSLTVKTTLERFTTPTQIGSDTAPPGDYVAIEVADTGPGIPDDIKDKIFDPFFTTKDIGAGTGLGLSMVYGSMQQMNGFVSVKNRDPQQGGGAVFTLYVPSADTSDMPVIEARASAETGGDVTGGGSILLVEDEDAVRLFSARALRSKGYIVTEARTGAGALDILKDETFDLLITDMMMPEVDGATLIKEARKSFPELPVVCISGYTEETVAAEVSELPKIQFLPKPFSLKQLAAKVKSALDATHT